MKYVWVVMAAFFFGLGAGLLLCNSTISHLRRRLRALRTSYSDGTSIVQIDNATAADVDRAVRAINGAESGRTGR